MKFAGGRFNEVCITVRGSIRQLPFAIKSSTIGSQYMKQVQDLNLRREECKNRLLGNVFLSLVSSKVVAFHLIKSARKRFSE